MNKLLLIFAIASSSYAQGIATAPGVGAVDPKIPSPDSVLGYQIGDRFTSSAALIGYFERLVAVSDRIRKITYGESYEHRSLTAFIISSPSNLTHLEEIRQSNLRLTDPRALPSKAESDRIISKNPIIVYLSYGVHGGEASSPEAAMLTAYQLCAGTDDRCRAMLDSVVIIIDPNVNPDGRERYVQWVNSVAGLVPNTNAASLEHSEPWPGGRTNHYFFDLNRDLAWQTQKETQARIRFYREWMPQVHVDYHEMEYSGTYFFFPAAVPVHEALPPQVLKWGSIFGKGNAEALDKAGIPYYVAEHFDMFYPAYGDSWPTFNGATGMTYEKAGGSRASFAVRKPNGETLTLKERAREHFITSLATIETSVKFRRERLQDFYDFWVTALTSNPAIKGYLLAGDSDPSRLEKLIEILIRQGIEVYQLSEPAVLQAQKYFSPKWTKESFAKGTWFIPTNQPQSRLARTLLEPIAAARDTFFYDVSAWSLPVAAGVPAWISQSPMPAGASRITVARPARGQVFGEKHPYAYLIPWERNKAISFVWQLLEKGYPLSAARRSFVDAGRSFGAGTIIAFPGTNGDSLQKDITKLADQTGVDVYAVGTGLTEKGISLGSSYIVPIKKPSIAVAAGSPVNSTDYGELWFLFEQDLGIPFTAVRATELADADLSKFDVIILPDASNYRSVFDSSKTDRFKQWIQRGGILIGIEGGAQFLTKSKSGITSAMLKSEKKEEDKSKEEKELEKSQKELSKRQSFFEKEERDRLERIPGTIFKVLVDTTHPIGFGMPAEVYALKSDSPPIELSDSGHNVARFSRDSAQVSGYAAKDKAGKVAEAAFIQDFRIGRGRAVLFAEDITFRQFWTGLEKLLLNAILFLPVPD